MEVAPDFVKAVRIQWLDTYFLNQNLNLSDLASVSTALTNLGFGVQTAGQVLFGNGTSTFTSEAELFYDATNNFLGIGTNAPSSVLHLRNDSVELDSILEARSDTLNPHLQINRARATNANLSANDVIGDLDFIARHNSTSATVAVIEGIYTGNGTTRSGAISFKVGNSGAPAELVRFNADSSVIIGTTVQKLANGKLAVGTSANTAPSANGHIHIKSTTSDGTGLCFEESGSTFNTQSGQYAIYPYAGSTSNRALYIGAIDSSSGSPQSNGGIYISKYGVSGNGNNVIMFANQGLNLQAGTPANFYFMVAGGSAATNTLAPSANSGTWAMRNGTNTANNYSGFVYENSGGLTTSGIFGVHESHAASTGHIEFITGNAGTLQKSLIIGSDGTIKPGTSGQDLGTALLRWDLFVDALNTSLSDGVAYVATNALTTEATLAIARGGTNGATALAGFNNLSPLTTKGDLLTRDGTNNIRLAVGANYGASLVVDAAQTSGLKWGPAMRAGRKTLAAGVRFAGVSLTNNMPSTSYTVVATLSNLTDNNSQYQPVTTVSKSTSGFSVEWNEITDSANYVLNWIIMEDFA